MTARRTAGPGGRRDGPASAVAERAVRAPARSHLAAAAQAGTPCGRNSPCAPARLSPTIPLMDAGDRRHALASSVVAPLVKKLFVSEGAGAGLVDKPVRISSARLLQGREADAEREGAGTSCRRELVGRAVRAQARTRRPRPRQSRESVALALAADAARTRATSTWTTCRRCASGPRGFAPAARQAARRHCTAPRRGRVLYRASLLQTACLHILHFFTQRSTFVARTLVEQSRQLAELVTHHRRADRARARAVRRGRRVSSSGTRDYIARKHGTLTIYGMDLNACPRVAAGRGVHEPGGDAGTEDAGPPTAGGARRASARPAARRPGALRARAGAAARRRGLRQDHARPVAGRHRRPAGRRPGTGPPARPRALRPAAAHAHARRRRLPTPDDFLAAVGCPLAGAQPPGWADRVLAAGRGLLLVDGIDEVPEQERRAHPRAGCAS